jgi:hypothetical protein
MMVGVGAMLMATNDEWPNHLVAWWINPIHGQSLPSYRWLVSHEGTPSSSLSPFTHYAVLPHPLPDSPTIPLLAPSPSTSSSLVRTRGVTVFAIPGDFIARGDRGGLISLSAIFTRSTFFCVCPVARPGADGTGNCVEATGTVVVWAVTFDRPS